MRVTLSIVSIALGGERQDYDMPAYSSEMDWGEMLDDQGPEFWEQVCWPDDELIEDVRDRCFEDYWHDDFDDYEEPVRPVDREPASGPEFDDPELDRQDERRERVEENMADWEDWAHQEITAEGSLHTPCVSTAPADEDRQEQILAWLQTSDLARTFRSRNGFFVRGGSTVVLLDGRELDAILWLFSEGFLSGARIGGYEVVYNGTDSPWGESLSFFPYRVEAPF